MVDDSDNKKQRAVGLLFNVGITIMALYLSFSFWLFDREAILNANISCLPLVRDHLTLEIVVGIVHILIIFILGPLLIKLIWNRVITRIVSARILSTGEAYSIYILLLFLSGFF